MAARIQTHEEIQPKAFYLHMSKQVTEGEATERAGEKQFMFVTVLQIIFTMPHGPS